MNTRADRIWLFGGVIAIVLVAVGSWFLLISPKKTEAEDVRTNTSDQQTQLITLKHEVATLKAQNAQIATYNAKQATLLQALPATTLETTFLRRIQASAKAMNVAMTGQTDTPPAVSTSLKTVWEVPITLTVSGLPADLSRFLTQLQNVQPRAVLITQISLSPAAATGAATTTTAGTPTTYQANVSLKAYVQPPANTTPVKD